MLLSRRSTRDILLRRASPASLFPENSTPRSFQTGSCVQEADSILNAADDHEADLTKRLPESYAEETRNASLIVQAGHNLQKGNTGQIGELTIEQNERLEALLEQMSRARETAKLAFKGQTVKLHEQFQVGIKKPNDLGSILQRAGIILASLKKSDNTAALESKGWLATDTTAFESAIKALDTADNVQEKAKTGRIGSTGDRNRNANDLFERLLTIQNAANLQWPESKAANVAIRAEFRLGKFPPHASAATSETQPAATPSAPQPPAQPRA